MGLVGSLGQVAYDIIMNDRTSDSTKSAQQNMMVVGAAMTGVGVAAKFMVDDCNSSFLQFDKSQTAVKALGAVSEEEFEKMRKYAIDLSTQVPISATDVSDAMYKMVSVGYDFDTMMSTIPEATKMAVGGNIELADAVDGVINVFGAYGTEMYSAESVTNIFSKAVGVGKWELGDFMTEIMKNIGVAAQLGISFEDLAAANVLLQNKFTSAEEAGTAMKTMLMRLVDPKVQEDLQALGVNVKDREGNFVGLESVLTQLGSSLGDMGGSSSKLAMDFASLGISVYDGEGKFRGMNTILNEVNQQYSRTGEMTPELKDKFEALGFKIDEKTGKLELSKSKMKEYDEILSATGGDVDKMAKLQTIFGTEGIRAALALIDEKDNLAGLSSEMDDATFKQNAYNTVVESAGAKQEIATNKMEAAKIMMGEAMAPATELLAGLTGGLAASLMLLPEPLQGIAGMGLFAAQGLAALGPLLMGLGALKGLGLAGTLGSIATALQAISVASMLSSAATGITAIGTALKGLIFGSVATSVVSTSTALATVGTTATVVSPAMYILATALWAVIPPLAGIALGLAVVYALKEVGFLDWVYEQGQNCRRWLDDLAASWNGTADDIESDTSRIKNSVQTNLGGTTSITKTETQKMTDTAKTWSVDFTKVFSGVTDTLNAWSKRDMNQMFFDAGSLIGNGIGGIYLAIKHFPKTLSQWTSETASAISTLPGKFKDTISGIGKAIEDLPETVNNIIQDASEALNNWPQTLEDTANAISSVDLGGAASSAIGGAVSVFDGAIGIIDPVASTLYGYMQSFFSGILAGLPDEMRGDLLNVFNDISTAFSALGGSVQEAFTNLFTGIGSFIESMAQGFVAMGYNIIMYLIQGMQSAASGVTSTIGGIAGVIADFLQMHSPAKEGPLSVPFNIGQSVAGSLLEAIPQVQAASLEVAAAATMPVSQPAAASTNTTTTTNDNSVSIGNVNASKDYSITDIMAEIATMQAQKRAQRGVPSG